MESGTQMGPMSNPRRIAAMETFIGDAVLMGATLKTGGQRIGNKGNFFEPTVLTDVPKDSRIMNEEPFGPVAVIAPFRDFDDRGKSPALRPCRLCLYPLGEDRPGGRGGGRDRDDLDQSPRPRSA
jgi:succinate-semialdehyde dehydrogenase/glutarate-semialdehyde dehydrogenase